MCSGTNAAKANAIAALLPHASDSTQTWSKFTLLGVSHASALATFAILQLGQKFPSHLHQLGILFHCLEDSS
jgi:hypothetical protein